MYKEYNYSALKLKKQWLYSRSLREKLREFMWIGQYFRKVVLIQLIQKSFDRVIEDGFEFAVWGNRTSVVFLGETFNQVKTGFGQTNYFSNLNFLWFHCKL